jgi:hypothetical protein
MSPGFHVSLICQYLCEPKVRRCGFSCCRACSDGVASDGVVSDGVGGKDRDDTDKRRMDDRDKRRAGSVGSGMADEKQDEPQKPSN